MYLFIERDIYTCHVLLVIQLTAEFGGCVPWPQNGDLGDLMPVLCTTTGAQSNLLIYQNISLW